jgi:hypothetical protein
MRALRLMRWIAFAGIALFLAAIVVFEFAPGVREFALSPSGGAVIKPRSLKGKIEPSRVPRPNGGYPIR